MDAADTSWRRFLDRADLEQGKATRYRSEGAKGACYVDLRATEKDGTVRLDAGWSCVVVHDGDVPVSWLAELVAIATAHEGGIAGFLRERSYGGAESYALTVDPP